VNETIRDFVLRRSGWIHLAPPEMSNTHALARDWRSEQPPAFPLTAEQRSVLGGARRKSMFLDSRGVRWLFKPQSLEQSLVDEAAATIARAAGVPSPLVFIRSFTIRGVPYLGSLQRMLDYRSAELSRELADLSPLQRQSLQQHHVVDWLLGNVDAHRGQFLIMHDDTIIGIDKAQSLRFFAHDKLQWDSNYWPLNTRQPVYWFLYQGVRGGRFMLDPSAAIRFAEAVSTRFYPGFLHFRWKRFVSTWPLYRLAFANSGLPWNRREAEEQVLGNIELRKNNLAEEFTGLYYHRSNGAW
jgi:hypothetical protein